MPFLQRLFSPQSVAFIGGSWAREAAAQSVRSGFSGELFLVNPRAEAIAGTTAYRSLDELPHAPDAAFVAVNRHATIDTISALSAMGCGGAVCFASGFDEAGAGELSTQLNEAAGAMPFLGPNCYGLINYTNGTTLWPDQHGGGAVERGVAIISQSGNISINLTMQKRGLPLALICAVGNQTRIGFAELTEALLADERISAIGWLMEGVAVPDKLEQVVRAAHGKKPIVALKFGSSEQGAAAALSHTATLTGNDAAVNAFFQRYGVARVQSLSQFLETLKLLHFEPPLAARTLLTLSCSGGEAALAGDTAERHAVTLKPFSDTCRQVLQDELGELVAVQNPFDYHTFIWNDTERLQRTYAAAMADGFAMSLLILDFPRRDRCTDTSWRDALAAFVRAKTQTAAAAGVVTTLPENMDEDIAAVALAAGVCAFYTLEDAMAACACSADISACWQNRLPPPLIARARQSSHGTLITIDEYRSKQLLAAAGVAVPAGICTAAAAVEADDFTLPLNYPLAVKGLGIVHKTEQQAVHLHCPDMQSVCRAAAALRGISTQLLIEEMITNAVAELIVGIRRDPLAGLVMTIGSGGIYTELMRDTATLLLPTTPAAVAQALSTLRIAPLWQGYRGGQGGDSAAAIGQIMALAAFAEKNAAILLELEVNPLIIGRQGAVAADALLVVDDDNQLKQQ